MYEIDKLDIQIINLLERRLYTDQCDNKPKIIGL